MFLFKNLSIFHIDDLGLDEKSLSEKLEALTFAPCKPDQEESAGWVAPLDSDPGNYTYQVNGAQALMLKREVRSVPAKVVADQASDRIAEYKRQLPDGQKPDKDDIAAIKEEVKRKLLPKAFSTSDIIMGYIDRQKNLLVINTPSPAKADLFNHFLREAVGSVFSPRPAMPVHDADEIMANWMRNDDVPEDIIVGTKCKIVRDGETGSITYQKQDIEDDDHLRSYLSGGRKISEMQMCWDERASFVLTSSFIFKGVKFVGDLQKEIKEMGDLDWATRFDASFALMTSQVRELYDGMMDNLGGESR